jgi:protein ImuB
VRISCVEVPTFALQVLAKSRPDWRAATEPVVVIDEDRPQGFVLEANAAARAGGVLPGQRYADALGLVRGLRAGVIPPEVLGAHLSHVLGRLRAFSPEIEPSSDEPGVFWLDASGLGGLYESLGRWARDLLKSLDDEGFFSLVAIGFSRFGSYAAVKSLLVPDARGGPVRSERGGRRSFVLTTPEAERALAQEVPLGHLALSAGARERLARLGVKTLGELMALPEGGVMKRYGPEALALHRLAASLGQTRHTHLLAPLPGSELRPEAEVLPILRRKILDFLEYDAHRLLFGIKSLLDELIPELAQRQALIGELRLELGAEARGTEGLTFHLHRFRPAAATLDSALLLDLVRLRLEGIDLQRGIGEVRLEAIPTPADPEQMRLFKLGPHQDGEAAARALTRVQAELGDAAVGRMALRDAHLPRARQAFLPLWSSTDTRKKRSLPPPAPTRSNAPPPLIRRLLVRAEPLPPRPRDLRNDGWQPRDPAQGPIVAVHGPFTVAGGWWLEGPEVHRDYHLVETKRGDILWIFHDRRRRRWLEEGRVE